MVIDLEERYVDTILTKFVESWLGSLYFIIGNAVTIWVGLTLGNRISKDIHLPYWFIKFFRKNEYGLAFPVSNLTNNQVLARKVEKALYGLHGDFKKLGIINDRKNSVGTPYQFDHRTDVEVLGIDRIFLMRFENIGSRFQQYRFLTLLNLFSSYVQGHINSELLEVLQTITLNIFGYEIPFAWRERSFKIIRSHFLRPFIFNGVVNITILDDLIEMQELLIPRNQYVNYKNLEKRILDDFRYDDRQNHNDEQIAKLLRQTKIAFYNYGDNTNSGGVL